MKTKDFKESKENSGTEYKSTLDIKPAKMENLEKKIKACLKTERLAT